MNKLMIRWVALLALGGFVALAPTTQAAEGPRKSAPAGRQRGDQAGRRGHVQGMLKKLARQLDLTEPQIAKLKPQLRAQMGKLAKLRRDSSLSAEEKRAAFRKGREELMATVKQVLTPEQQAKWKKMQAKRSPEAKEGKGAKKKRGDQAGQRGPKPGKGRKGHRAAD